MRTRNKTVVNRDNGLMYLLMAPALIIVFTVSIVPLFYTFILSFQNYALTRPDQANFAGVQNYITIFTEPVLWRSILITFEYTVGSVAISIVIGIILAVIVNNVPFGKTVYRITLFAPMMFSAVVMGVIWRFLFNSELGILNYLLSLVGIGRVQWLGSPTIAKISIIIADVWQWSSYTFILVLAAFEAMNPEPLEAGRIDGANPWQLFWLIKLPAIIPVIEVAAVFRFIWAFRGFDLIYALTKGGPGTATQTMALEICRQAFTQYNIGLSSALSVVMFVLLILLSMGILRKTMRNSGRSAS